VVSWTDSLGKGSEHAESMWGRVALTVAAGLLAIDGPSGMFLFLLCFTLSHIHIGQFYYLVVFRPHLNSVSHTMLSLRAAIVMLGLHGAGHGRDCRGV